MARIAFIVVYLAAAAAAVILFNAHRRPSLPPESPLWRQPNVLLTPHIAGDSPAADQRVYELVGDQIRRHLKGRPLLNVVRSAGSVRDSTDRIRNVRVNLGVGPGGRCVADDGH